jgi:hypothetical protein
MNPEGLHDVAEVNVLYVNDGSVPPEVGEEIATFRNVNGAFKKITSSLQTCTKIHGDNPNASGVSGSVVPLVLPHFGTGSEAVVATLTDESVPVTLTDDLVLIEKGKYVVEVYEANFLGKVNHRQFEEFIAKALSKV